MDLVAQAVIFLFAGLETVSTTMAFVLHELAVNPDYQERLVQEIRESEKRNDGKLDYSSIQQMTYLDMFVSGMWMCETNTTTTTLHRNTADKAINIEIKANTADFVGEKLKPINVG